MVLVFASIHVEIKYFSHQLTVDAINVNKCLTERQPITSTAMYDRLMKYKLGYAEHESKDTQVLTVY